MQYDKTLEAAAALLKDRAAYAKALAPGPTSAVADRATASAEADVRAAAGAAAPAS